jgi:GNAT superfamily N-acetyltransferase
MRPITQSLYRLCRREDLPAVQALVDELYETDMPEVGVHPRIAPTFDEFERHPDKGRIMVFDHDGQVIGYAIIVFFWSNEYGGDVIEIDEMVVAKLHRGKGFGSSFFAWLEKEFPDHVALALQVSERNPAKRMYERVGFALSRNQYLIRLRS